MTKKCPTCGGDGIVVSEHTAAVDVERRLRSLVTPGSRSKAFKVEVAAKVAWLVAGEGGTRLREIEETTKRRFFLVGVEDEHLDHFRVLDQGTLEKVAPKLPVEAGQEIDVKLGEVGLYDPHAGVGKIDDVDIVVGNAAKLVGKKVKARVTVVTDGLAWAELLAPVEQGDEPLTAEAEAERPTRARRTTVAKKTEAAAVEVEEAEEAGDADEAEEAEDAEEPAVAEDGETPAAAKKKTRRGSRGGRNRKKKPAAAAGAVAVEANGAEPEPEVLEPEAPEPEPEAEEEPAEPATAGPVIHLPDRDLGAEEDGDAPAPAKKRTRRGSRGGRNRKKKPAASSAAAETNGAEPSPEPDAPESEPDWGYTPMSEWGLDDSQS